MKKINNKYRNNNSSNNTIYSLNYKFDSNSIAGKISGTALDLIKRYNDFAKDAQSNNDYVNAEIFRQYAEHYRKIVTEINERKNLQRASEAQEANDNRGNSASEPVENTVSAAEDKNNPVAAAQTSEISPETTAVAAEEKAPKKEVKKSFKIIEISHAKADEAKADAKSDNAVATSAENSTPAPKRVYRRKAVAATS